MKKEKNDGEVLFRVTFTEKDTKRKISFDIFALDSETAKKKAKDQLFDGVYYIPAKSNLTVAVKLLPTY